MLAVLLSATAARGQLVPLGDEFQVNSEVTSFQVFPAVAVDARGNFLVAWRSDRMPGGQVVVARPFDRAGSPLGPEFRTGDSGDEELGPVVAGSSAGGFVVAWHTRGDDDYFDVLAQRYDEAGAPVGPGFQVNAYSTDSQKYPAVAFAPDGRFVVVWQSYGQDGDGWDVFARRFDASGVPLGGEFRVNTYTTGAQNYSAVAVDDGGRMMVTWRSAGQDGSGEGVFAQRLGPGGGRLGGELQVNVYTTGDQARQRVRTLPAGCFVVVWDTQTDIQDREATDVVGRLFDAGGAPAGPEFAVATYTTGQQSNPEVAADRAGNFVVLWNGYRPDEDASGVFGQQFTRDGLPIDGEFRVNTYTTGVQGSATLSAEPDGRFVVTFTGRDADGYGIVGRRFAGPVHVAGKRLVIEDPGAPAKRSITLASNDPGVDTASGTAMDPTVEGATLHVYNAATGDSACLPLPAAGWTRQGTPFHPVFAYEDKAFAGGPCKSAVVRDGKLLKAACSAKVLPISYTLDEPEQGAVSVTFTSGLTRYCASFGGVVKTDRPGKFNASASPAPSSCPEPPATCP